MVQWKKIVCGKFDIFLASLNPLLILMAKTLLAIYLFSACMVYTSKVVVS